MGLDFRVSGLGQGFGIWGWFLGGNERATWHGTQKGQGCWDFGFGFRFSGSGLLRVFARNS